MAELLLYWTEVLGKHRSFFLTLKNIIQKYNINECNNIAAKTAIWLDGLRHCSYRV
jgi:hypothetical protein